MIYHVDYNKPFELFCDASDYGIGGVLVQEGNIVGMYSNKFNSAEKHYTTTEKEGLAVIKTLKHFKPVLFGSKIIVFTDHLNLSYLHKSTSPKIQRWRIFLEEFNIQIKHVKGNENTFPDMLSRDACMKAVSQEISYCFPPSKEKIIKMQKKYINENNNSFLDNDGIFKNRKDNKINIPDYYLKDFLTSFHFKLGHPGIVKSINTLKEVYSIKNLAKRVIENIKYCKFCSENKAQINVHGLIEGDMKEETPWKKVYVDIYGPLSKDECKLKTNKEKFYLLVMIDACTRWTEVAVVENIKTDEIASKIYDHWISRYPIPEILHSDKGTCFTSKDFKEFLCRYGIKLTTTIGYNPTGNSVVERVNQTIGNIIRIYKGFDLENVVSLICNNLNNTYHSTIETSPSNLVFGVNKFDITRYYDRRSLLNEANLKNEKRIVKTKFKTNLKRKEYNLLGKKVWIRNKIRTKTSERNLGPFKVLSHKNNLGIVELDLGYYKKWVGIRDITKVEL